MSRHKTIQKLFDKYGRLPLDVIQRQLKCDNIRKRDAKKHSLDGRVCEICGSSKDLTRHHITYKPSKVQILCGECHDKIHRSDHVAS